MKDSKYYLRKLFCHVFMFFLSGTVYYTLEILFKTTHKSHWTMFLLAACAGLFFIDGLNDLFGYDMDFLLQCFICSTAITVGELCVGLIWNNDFGIWDYRNMPLNYKGQICVPFYFVWYLLSAIFIPFLDYIEWKWFDFDSDNAPYYKVFGKIIFKFKPRKEHTWQS